MCHSKQQNLAVVKRNEAQEPLREVAWCLIEHSSIEMLTADRSTTKPGCSKLAGVMCRPNLRAGSEEQNIKKATGFRVRYVPRLHAACWIAAGSAWQPSAWCHVAPADGSPLHVLPHAS